MGVAIAGGIVGLALGAAIANNGNNGHYRSGYSYGYAPPPPPPPRYYAPPVRAMATPRATAGRRANTIPIAIASYERTVCR